MLKPGISAQAIQYNRPQPAQAGAGENVAENYKYKAFISYSHKDEKWAAWLHRALETYKVPKQLVGEVTDFGPVPERLAPVFRDREELSSATRLGDALERALAGSAVQIVICSPNAAQSHWTNEEILTYKRLGRSDRIFCLIVDGEPGSSDAECFPEALRYEIGDDGELTDTLSEPIAADARKGKDGRSNAKLKLIAGILGVDFDRLKQREHHRQQRRMLVLATAAIVGMAITSGLAVSAWLARNEAEAQRARAEIEADKAQRTTEFLVGVFRVVDPSEARGNSITARELLDKGAASIETDLADQPEVQADLMDAMGTAYTGLGLYPEAVRLADGAVRRRLDVFGDEHPVVARSRSNLGRVLTLAAEYEAAEGTLRDALATRRAVYGDESSEVAETATLLADVLKETARYDDALLLVEEALSIRKALYSGGHVAIAENLEDIGLIRRAQGQYAEAVRHLREAVGMRRAVDGENSPELAQAVNNLALTLLDLDEAAEAETYFREALAMKRVILGDVHPEIATGLNNIGFTLELRGELEQAEEHYRQSLTMTRQLLSAAHPDVAERIANLAFVRYARGATDDAIANLREALEMRQATLGPMHPATAGTATNLGFWLIDEGAYDEAEPMLLAALAARRESLGADHPQTAGTMTVLANLYLATSQFDAALGYARDAEAILAASLPDDHWRLAAARNTTGLALAGTGAYAEAEPILLASLAGLENAPIPDLADDAHEQLAQFYEDWGRPAEAGRYRNRIENTAAADR